MEVTPIGFILLLLGPLLMACRPKWLYIATIFFLPFTATDLINVGTGITASGLQASMYLGTLLLLRWGYDVVFRKRISYPTSGRLPLVFLGLFTLSTIASLAMPVWISGRLQVPSGDLLDLTTEPLYLSGHNITGVLYIIYGYFFSYYVSLLNKRKAISELSTKTFIAGCTFASLWGVMELFCKIIGFPYPAVIFNTGKAASTLGYLEQLTGGFYRLTSVAVEPSILSETLLAAIAIYLPYIFGKDRLFGRILDKFLLMLMSSILLLTTSSTGYLGVVIIALNVIGFLVAKRMLRFRYLLIPTFGLLVFIGLYFSIPIVQQILDAALFSKATDYSALERMTTILNAYDMFIQYPILGIGWATVTSHDLIFKILANAGIIALVLFILAMACILYNLQRSINMRSKSLRLAGLMQRDFGIYLALSTILVTSVISGFLNTFSFFWFIIGMAIAEDTRDSNDKLSNKSLTLQGQEPIH